MIKFASFFILTALLFNTVLAQKKETRTVQFSKLEAVVDNCGTLFYDGENQKPGLTHLFDKAAVLFGANLCLTGKTNSGEIHSSIGIFSGPGRENDFFPNTTNDNAKDSIKNYAIVTENDINFHIENYSNTEYKIAENIKNWPANRKNKEEEVYTVAPFVDLNNNGIYEPTIGDYPDIAGTTMLFMIINDLSDKGNASSGKPIGVDVYISMYTWNTETNQSENNSIVVNYKIINRGNQSYSKLSKGLFIDYDLGNKDDDYLVSDSTLKMFYTYNADNFDETISGTIFNGFGENPPAFGAKVLCGNFTGFMYHNLYSGIGEIITPTEWDNLLNSKWPKDGRELRSGGDGYNTNAPITKFAFNGNPLTQEGWTNKNSGIPPQDFQAIVSFNSNESFNPGDEQNFTVAFNYARDFGNNNIENIETLKSNFSDLDNFIANNSARLHPYWKNNFCNISSVGVQELDKFDNNLSIYPNPTNTTLNIVSIKDVETVTILSLDGKTLISTNTKNVDVRALETGIYIVQANFKGDGSAVSKFEKQ